MLKLAPFVVVALLCVAAVHAETVMLPMRDGVKLHTVINKPIFTSHTTNLTAIIDRSPYGQDALELVGLGFGLAEGFVSVRQDQRGTQQSQGNFSLWHHAANDSYDTFSYLTKQPWSNGRVVSVGASADGLASFPMILDRPPWLKGQTIIFATAKAYSTIVPGGALRQSLVEFWLESTVPDQAAGVIQDIKEHEGPSEFWAALDLTGKYDRVDFPATLWAGWYDIFLVGNLIGFEGYQHEAKTPGQCYFVVDPLGHCQDAYKYYDKDTLFGRALLPVLQAYEMLKADGEAKTPSMPESVDAVTFYVMGDNSLTDKAGYWTSLPDFPKYTPLQYYFHGDTTLSTSAPAAGQSPPALNFTYDPTQPVPTMGGNNLKIKCGPLDQTPVEAPARKDVLTFTSAALTEDMAVVGPLHADLWVSSSAVDTDFAIKLTDVYPESDGSPGASRLIQDGMVRMRWRNLASGQTEAKNMTAGSVYHVTASLWNTSYVFAKGHRVRVSVSSSNYPRFTLNQNNGWPLALSGGPNITAHNTVFTDETRPSSITLPTVSFADLPPKDVLADVRDAVRAMEPADRDRIVAVAEALEHGVARRAGKDRAPEPLIFRL